MSALIYSRVSTSMQAEDGSSLANQRERCQTYADQRGIQVVGQIEDAGVSAKSLDRSGIRTLLASIEEPTIDTVIALKFDRLTRSLDDWPVLSRQFQEHGVAFRSATEEYETNTPSGWLQLTMLLVFSEFERRQASDRVSSTMQHLKRQGYRMGPAPWGWRLVAHDGPGNLIEPLSDEHLRVIEAVRLLADCPLRAIARAVSVEFPGFLSGHPQQVKQVLAAPTLDEVEAVDGGYLYVG